MNERYTNEGRKAERLRALFRLTRVTFRYLSFRHARSKKKPLSGEDLTMAFLTVKLRFIVTL